MNCSLIQRRLSPGQRAVVRLIFSVPASVLLVSKRLLSRLESSLLLLFGLEVVLVPALLANLAPGHVRGVVPGAGLARPAHDARRTRRGGDFGALRRTGNANGAR